MSSFKVGAAYYYTMAICILDGIFISCFRMYRRARAALQQQGRRHSACGLAARRGAACGVRRTRIPFHVTHCVFDRRSFQLYQEVRECARYFGCLEKMQQHCCVSSVLEIENSLLRVYAFLFAFADYVFIHVQNPTRFMEMPMKTSYCTFL